MKMKAPGGGKREDSPERTGEVDSSDDDDAADVGAAAGKGREAAGARADTSGEKARLVAEVRERGHKQGRWSGGDGGAGVQA